MKIGDLVRMKKGKKGSRFIIMQGPWTTKSGDVIVKTKALDFSPFPKGANVSFPIEMIEVIKCK